MKKLIRVILLSIFIVGIMSGFNQYTNQNPTLFVQSKVKSNNVFVECILTGISFRESDQKVQKVGKVIIWLDGKRTQEVNTAAFIIKNLPPGRHEVKLEVVDLKNVSYGLTNEFLVNIPK
ncbi:hypothetical protein J2Y03_001410 [Neobacillus niacini]|uniref:hypothetical protein n=1 Tax=Neobacillus niacini TaxID=86668 RepID=UPI002863CA4D|nr:hypothetical protein [Neobacillus niacini]MDR7076407.1 hypothetical protein [Neobacillus niacini]